MKAEKQGSSILIFAYFYVFYFLSYKHVNTNLSNIATVFWLTVNQLDWTTPEAVRIILLSFILDVN